MKTLLPDRPIREIDHAHNKRWAKFYECPSESNPTGSYIVAVALDGQWGCGCPRWIFKRENCKHINRVQAFLASGSVMTIAALHDLSEKARKAMSRFASLGDDVRKRAEVVTASGRAKNLD